MKFWYFIHFRDYYFLKSYQRAALLHFSKIEFYVMNLTKD